MRSLKKRGPHVLDDLNDLLFSLQKHQFCTDRHLATSLITSSQPLMLLLAPAVYDLLTGTVSLCLAVDSALTAVGRSTTPARQSGSGTRCQMNLEMQTVWIVLSGS